MSISHFIPADSPVLPILEAILSAAGENFGTPYNSDTQPNDMIEANSETLIQYQMPGGSQLEGHANPASGGNIGTAINSMLGLLSPAISAYALILPILGVIRGIIEILCCLMNPFCVIPAVIRLFKKWIPPFISLFPPLAGVVILISTIKAILAIVFFIMTEVIPTIELIISNIKNMAALFSNTADLNDSQLQASQTKLENVLKTLIQKTGVMAVFKPLLDLIFLILRLVAGFPCKGGKSKSTDASTSNISTSPISFSLDERDSSCCEEDLCPEILNDRSKAPKGAAILIKSGFGDCAPFFVFRLITGNPEVAKLEQYQESFQEQLNCQLDEPIKFSKPAGSNGDRSLLKVKLSDRTGLSREFIVPVLDISGTVVKIVSPLGFLFLGQLVNYEIVPDYEMLIHQGIMGVACHPDVTLAREEIAAQYPQLDDGTSTLDNNPEGADLQDDYDNALNTLNLTYSDIGDAVAEVGDITDELLQDLADGKPIDDRLPPFDDQINQINDARDNFVDTFNNFASGLSDALNSVISRNVNSSASTFDVSKEVVRADAEDFAIITIIPRDVTGTPILKSVPSTVDLNVQIITDFGVISNQQLNSSEGTVTAQIASSIIGEATISVRINDELIVDNDGTTTTTRTRQVSFVAEDALPIRRRRSKPSTKSAINTGTTSEREPGNR